MEESFELPVTYNEKELTFPSKLIQFGYTYRIEVEVNGTIVSFDRDEERAWRVSIDPGTTSKIPGNDLVEAILRAIERLAT